jgi:hypothetical protein
MRPLKPVVGERLLLNLGINNEASDVFGDKGLTIYFPLRFFLLPEFPNV